jgi:flagella basal body P-ring formation protein FlgA
LPDQSRVKRAGEMARIMSTSSGEGCPVIASASTAPSRSSNCQPFATGCAVQQGQTTRMVLNGPGFSVQSEGQALANASRGDQERGKTRSGQVISGVAQDGQQVMVAF